jgi:hypothetical protein
MYTITGEAFYDAKQKTSIMSCGQALLSILL